MEQLTLTTPDGFRLDALFGKGSNGVGIIFVHGLAFHKEGEEPFMRAAEILSEMGFSTLLFDFRAHGKSSGTSEHDFTVSGQLIDIDTAVTYLKNSGVKDIYLAGASFGAGATILYTSQHIDTIKKLVLSNPTVNYALTIRKHFLSQINTLEEKGYIESGSRKVKFGKQLYNELQHLFPYKEIKKYTGDLLIIHGDKDSRIPYEGVKQFFDNLANPQKEFHLIHGSDHGFHEEPYTSQVAELIVDFFKKL